MIHWLTAEWNSRLPHPKNSVTSTGVYLFRFRKLCLSFLYHFHRNRLRFERNTRIYSFTVLFIGLWWYAWVPSCAQSSHSAIWYRTDDVGIYALVFAVIHFKQDTKVIVSTLFGNYSSTMRKVIIITSFLDNNLVKLWHHDYTVYLWCFRQRVSSVFVFATSSIFVLWGVLCICQWFVNMKCWWFGRRGSYDDMCQFSHQSSYVDVKTHSNSQSMLILFINVIENLRKVCFLSPVLKVFFGINSFHSSAFSLDVYWGPMSYKCVLLWDHDGQIL